LKKIWDLVIKYSINNIDLFLKILTIEGKNSKAISILKDLQLKKRLSEKQNGHFDGKLLQFNIKDEFIKLRNQLDINVNEEIVKSLQTIEANFNERIKLLTNGYTIEQSNLRQQIFDDFQILTIALNQFNIFRNKVDELLQHILEYIPEIDKLIPNIEEVFSKSDNIKNLIQSLKETLEETKKQEKQIRQNLTNRKIFSFSFS